MVEEMEAAIETETERNWADLLPELFSLILKKLPDISDFVRCRAVCKTWRLSSSVSDLPPQFPWIVKVSQGPNLEFYSIAFKKVYTIRARCSSGKRLLKPTGSYFLTAGQEGNDSSLSLLNPVTNSEVSLPVLHDYDPYLFRRNFSWSIPTSVNSDDYVLAVGFDKLFRCKPGDDKWDIIGLESPYNCCYFKGFLFRVDCETGVTKMMDISDCRQLCVIPPPKYEKMSNMFFEGPYLVESCGEILTVSYNQSYGTMDYKFYIYRLEYNNGKEKPYWVKLSTIGDRILFFEIPLGYGRAFSLRVSDFTDFTGFKGNCIYFIIKYSRVINMYDIENGKTKLIYSPFNWESPITWFMPTLNHI